MNKLLSKLSVFLVVIGLAVFAYADVWGADWKTFASADFGSFLYDTQSITRTSDKHVKVWTKLQYTKKGVREVVAELGKDYANLDNSIMLNEIDCTNRKKRNLALLYKSKDGRVIYSLDYRDAKWQPIVPDSKVEDLYEILCK